MVKRFNDVFRYGSNRKVNVKFKVKQAHQIRRTEKVLFAQ